MIELRKIFISIKYLLLNKKEMVCLDIKVVVYNKDVQTLSEDHG